MPRVTRTHTARTKKAHPLWRGAQRGEQHDALGRCFWRCLDCHASDHTTSTSTCLCGRALQHGRSVAQQRRWQRTALARDDVGAAELFSASRQRATYAAHQNHAMWRRAPATWPCCSGHAPTAATGAHGRAGGRRAAATSTCLNGRAPTAAPNLFDMIALQRRCWRACLCARARARVELLMKPTKTKRAASRR